MEGRNLIPPITEYHYQKYVRECEANPNVLGPSRAEESFASDSLLMEEVFGYTSSKDINDEQLLTFIDQIMGFYRILDLAYENRNIPKISYEAIAKVNKELEFLGRGALGGGRLAINHHEGLKYFMGIMGLPEIEDVGGIKLRENFIECSSLVFKLIETEEELRKNPSSLA